MPLTRRKGIRRTGFKPQTPPVPSLPDSNTVQTRRRFGLRQRPWKPGASSTLAPVSHKQARRARALAEIKADLIAKRGPWCEACKRLADYRGRDTTVAVFASDGCSGYAEDLHHMLPRSLGGSDDETNLLLIGRIHHEWAEEAAHREEAIAAGVLRRTPPVAQPEQFTTEEESA